MERFNARRLSALLAIGAVLYLLPFVLSRGALPEATRLVVLAGTAISLNLLVGTTGLISLCQGLFLGVGAYAVALATIRYGFSFWQGALLALAASVPMAAITALISLRARHLFFGLLTMAIGQVAFYFVESNYDLTGGEDGLVGVTVPAWLDSDVAHHVFAVTFMMVVSILLLRLLASPFGAMLCAIRDNPERVASLGGNPKLYEFAAFVISGTLAGMFGVVFAGVAGNVDPTMVSWTTSNLLIVMIALGGRFTFLGPIFGAVILEVTRAYVQARSPNADLVVGILIILCAMVLPDGVGEPLKELGRRWSLRLRPSATHDRDAAEGRR
jgi:branched-chain amino acid transport system permease protein